MTAPAVQTQAPASTAQLLKVLTPELARAVPKGMDADRIARLVTTEVRKSRNAKAAGIAKQSLEDCTQESFAGALLTASALGLEPGVNGECYLVPYRDNRRRVVECQLIIGYQGIVKLFWQHPRAARVDAQWVGENDEFRYTMGLNPTLEHVKAKGDRGKPVYYYAVVEVTGAQPLWDVFTADEIKELRRGKVGSSGDIKDPQHWMERKTALKQVLKLAPKTTRLDAAIRSDDRPGTDLSRSQALELPPAVQATPDYIEGQIEPSVEVVYASADQVAQINAALAKSVGEDLAAQQDWLSAWKQEPVDSPAELTFDDAARLLTELQSEAQK
ncbi:recombinase RecT [Mycobacterium sp. CnD-18-1]|uniref:recombinase RecT n=1 Tax=Mycobacterium sp. CnD-18-1 TaxID=2917744 RepID=UPI001EF2437B|nr:recombinase RecT [Mycobacterium sp. CnD-18-1]MCG7610375.1 recombinase RecT [Mycobacterium sp. CnD-18-1]